MTAPAVRPAVACVAWPNAAGRTPCVGDTSHYSQGAVEDMGLEAWPVTAIDGTADQIAARVREVVAANCDHYVSVPCKSCALLLARMLATLGITTEARDG